MAGGPNAKTVVCYTCALKGEIAPAERVYEGLEDDHYECAKGHKYGIDWAYSGPPDKPQFPPDEEVLEQIALLRSKLP